MKDLKNSKRAQELNVIRIKDIKKRRICKLTQLVKQRNKEEMNIDKYWNNVSKYTETK